MHNLVLVAFQVGQAHDRFRLLPRALLQFNLSHRLRFNLSSQLLFTLLRLLVPLLTLLQFTPHRLLVRRLPPLLFTPHRLLVRRLTLPLFIPHRLLVRRLTLLQLPCRPTTHQLRPTQLRFISRSTVVGVAAVDARSEVENLLGDPSCWSPAFTQTINNSNGNIQIAVAVFNLGLVKSRLVPANTVSLFRVET